MSKDNDNKKMQKIDVSINLLPRGLRQRKSTRCCVIWGFNTDRVISLQSPLKNWPGSRKSSNIKLI